VFFFFFFFFFVNKCEWFGSIITILQGQLFAIVMLTLPLAMTVVVPVSETVMSTKLTVPGVQQLVNE